jgi:hypothetical protein
MEEDIGDIEREQTTPEPAGVGQRPPNLPLDRSGASPQDEEIKRLWAQEMSPDIIASEVGLTLETLYRMLKRIQKDLIDDGGIGFP